jgi:gamma-glutamyl-gamma-aminobutyrate hydrolase PuuD
MSLSVAGFHRSVVDAVQDAAELRRAATEDVVEALAVERHLELVGVARADRRDEV